MIRPLDLQTLYMNLDKVSKETALSKEAAAQAQANQVQKLQKEHDAGQHAVLRTTPVDGDEVELRVHTDTHGGAGPDTGRQPQERPTEPEEPDNDQERWKDPQLGQHVDLSG